MFAEDVVPVLRGELDDIYNIYTTGYEMVLLVMLDGRAYHSVSSLGFT